LRDVSLLGRSGLFGQAEIEQLDSLFGEQDIRGLQVAMRDALAVRGVQSLQNLARVLDGVPSKYSNSLRIRDLR
jgi:hypothetical protein